MKIAILLPMHVNLALLRRARELSLLIGEAQSAAGSGFSVAIGLPEMPDQQWRRMERLLRADNPKTIVRHLAWEGVRVENARRMYLQFPEHVDLEGLETVMVPRDWGWNFLDCDAVIMFGDPAIGPVLPLRPTAVYCTDLAMRIVPDAFATSIDDPYWQRQVLAFRMWRQALVLVSHNATADDVLSYAGVRRDRIVTVPNLLDCPPPAPEGGAARNPATLVWLAEPNALHDLENSALGLATYLAEGGRLKPVLASQEPAGFEAETASAAVRHLPPALADLIYSLPRVNIGSDRELFRLLRRSGALWSSLVAGGEGEGGLLARQAGLPFIGADFAVNHTAGGAPGAYYYPTGDHLCIADALAKAEKQAFDGERHEAAYPVSHRAARVQQIGFLLDRLLEPTLVA